MNKYLTLDQLVLKDGSVYCLIRNRRKYQKVHLRQGDLDGACGAYAIVMALMLTNVVDSCDIRDFKFDGRFSEAKLEKRITKDNGLYKDGLTIDGCEDIIRSYSKYASTKQSEKGLFNKALLPFIEEHIKNNTPVILGIEFKNNGGHWLVVVGLVYNEKDELLKLLCLDSGFESPTYAPWNSVIDLTPNKKGKYFYTYETNNNLPASITEALAVIKK